MMRKPMLFIAVAAALSLTVFSVVSLSLKNASAPVPEAQYAEVPPATAPTEHPGEQTPLPEETRFMLRAHGGVIVVCNAETPEIPLHVTDITVASLRLYDQQRLQNGIVAEDTEELLLLLEDFAP